MDILFVPSKINEDLGNAGFKLFIQMHKWLKRTHRAGVRRYPAFNTTQFIQGLWTPPLVPPIVTGANYVIASKAR